MKKLVTAFKVFAVLTVFMLSSCQNETSEIVQETATQGISISDLKREITPPTSQKLPEAVQNQLNESKKNLEKYLKNDLQITGITVLGKLSTAKSVTLSHDLISDQSSMISFGNIIEPTTVRTERIGKLNSEELTTAQEGLKSMAFSEIKTDSEVLEITWNHKGENFTTLCFYNDSGIIWDNVLGGLVMMNIRGNSEESSHNAQAKVYSKWYKQWWTADWIWGSKRGEMGYKITIYYSGSTVSNTDVEDWANITLGKAKSESKVSKNSGAYGQCKFALGLCTPTGSLSFNSTNFSVSFSGLGSNMVHNGTKSLYP